MKPPFDGTRECTIERLGQGGDGLATIEGVRLYVPRTIPGDRITVTFVAKQGDGWRAEMIDLKEPSPYRQDPICPHFNDCGGCSLQHLMQEDYETFKRDMFLRALSRHAVIVDSLETHFIGPGTRRRTTFTITRIGDGIKFGYQERRSHNTVAIRCCPILHPKLQDILNSLLGDRADLLLGSDSQAQLQLQLADNNAIDALIIKPSEPDAKSRVALSELARSLSIARISFCTEVGSEPETIAALEPVYCQFDNNKVSLPVGAFLQPSKAGETALVDVVSKALDGCRAIADLYCGLGTFAFPLSARAKVLAVDIAADHVQALKRAAGPIQTLGRDLDRRPLMPEELKSFDGLVIDPPRKGAKAQCEMIVKAAACNQAPKRIAFVSCNPDTLGRDLKILLGAGYGLERVALIDQFTWSVHTEAVAFLKK